MKFKASAMALALFATTASAEELRVYNWSDYIDEALLEQFECWKPKCWPALPVMT